MKQIVAYLLFVAILLGICFVYITTGEHYISVGNLFNRAESPDQFIIQNIRLPRMLIVLTVGASLAVCGAFLQGVFRNPLAEPTMLGISQSAALGAALVIFLWKTQNQLYISLVSAIFSVGVCFLFILLAKSIGDFSNSHIIISGIAINLLCSSIVALIIYLSLPFYETSKQILFWLMGNIEGKGWTEALHLIPVTIAGLIYLLFNSGVLNYMSMDDVQANSVGVDVSKTRNNLLFVIGIMIAAASSIVGTIAFVGLLVPHLIRLVFGNDYRRIIPLSMIIGAMFLLLIDLSSRTILSSYQIQLGTIASLIGAPFIIAILLVRRPWA